MYKVTIAALALALLSACSAKVNNLPGQCTTSADCPNGGSCDTTTGVGLCTANCGDTVCGAEQICVSGHCQLATCLPACSAGFTCESSTDGGSPYCLQTDCVPACDTDYQRCDTGITPPACVLTTCHPTCASNFACVADGDGGFECDIPTTGAILITSPDAGALSGIASPLAVAAAAYAPGGPTQVLLEIFQGDGGAKSRVVAVAGEGNAFSGSLNLADAGLVTGPAFVVGEVDWAGDAGELDASSPQVPITIDADPPSYGAYITDRAFYSGTASPAQTAHITLPINDVGSAGVDPSSVTMTANGTKYSGVFQGAADAGGNGTYQFSVPVSALSTSNTFLQQVPVSVAASDNVGNSSSFTTGKIDVDNIPPSFGSIAYDAGTWFGGDAGISVSADVQDQENGSGLDAGSVAIVFSNGLIVPGTTSDGLKFTANTSGAAVQSAGQQGPVSFTFTAADNAGNIGLIDGGTLLVDLAAPTIVSTTVSDGNIASVSGWYPRDASGSKYAVVTTLLSDGNGSGPKSVTITAGAGSANTSTSGAVVSNGTSYPFNVPTNVQSAGSETPVTLTVSGSDAVGNTVGPAASSTTLQIDDKGPAVSGISVATTADGLGADGTTYWFNQKVSTDILVNATIVDNGSGVDISSAQLVLQSDGTTRVDYGTATAQGNNVVQFKIKRSAGPVASGAEKLIAFKVVAKDKVGNAQQADDANHVSTAQLGIDGKAPTVALAAALYPAAKAGCASDVDYCGHDGSHFWRKGETNAFGFTGSDSGAGVDTTSAGAASTCTVAGATGTCTSSYSTGDAQFEFTPDFSTATFSSGTDGTGTVSVTVTVKDRVGNVGTFTDGSVAVTRVKWARKMLTSAGINAFSGSPIVTSTPTNQIIFGGANNASPGPIVSLAPDGTKLWQAGNAQGITSISANMAYSPNTQLLYVVPGNSGASAYAMSLTGSSQATAGVGSVITCTGSKLVGSPSLIKGANGTEYAMIPDVNPGATVDQLDAFAVAGSSCSSAHSMTSTTLADTWSGIVSTATTDGTTVFVGHDDTSLAKATFSNGVFQNLTEALGFSSDVISEMGLTTSLYLADVTPTARYRAYVPNTLLPVSSWNSASAAGATNSVSAQTPIVSSSYVFGSFDPSRDGHLHAFDPTTGSSLFTYPTDSTKIGSISPVALGSDNVVYFSDSNNSELIALTTANNAPLVSWKFTGTSGVNISSVTTEPTIDSTGDMYFGDSAGNVFAIITDSPSTLAPVAGSTWPRVGFDNCNSGNTAFACK